MAMKSSGTSCAICENSNLASICANCVNYRLSERNSLLRSMNNARNSLYRKLEGELEAKRKMDEQLKWRVHQNERIAKLKERLHLLKEQLAQDKVKVVKGSSDLKVKQQALDSASAMLKRNRVELLEKFCRNLNCTQNLGHMAVTSDLLHKQSMIIKQICKLFPMRRVISDNKDGFSGPYDLICNARLPRGLDPHSVPSAELAASLGYMVQLLNLVVPKLAAPALHNSGFAGSCSRIWQRNSYWDARPSSQSTEYPLFIPRQNFCSSVGEASWSDRSSSSNFGVASVDSERKPCLDASGSSSFNYSSASPHSLETHKDLQKGISMLKKSVACITAFCSNSLCLEERPDASTFEAFAKLLATLSSSREMRGALSLKMVSPSSDTQGQRFNRLVWNANSSTSSSSLVESESTHTTIMYQPSNRDNLLSNADASYFYPTEIGDNKKSETLEGWDIVERPVFPPTSEHWMRAMFIDARKK